jgi:hypothetical protein
MRSLFSPSIPLRVLLVLLLTWMAPMNAKADESPSHSVQAMSCDLEVPGAYDPEAVNGSCTAPLSVGDHNCYLTGGSCPSCIYDCYNGAFGWHPHTWSNGCTR